MKPYTAFTELYLNHKMKEIRDCLNLLVKIAMITDNGFFDEVADREAVYLLIDNILRSIDEAYTLAESWESKIPSSLSNNQ